MSTTRRSAERTARAYLAWTLARACLHRGWWLVTSLYLVVAAGLTPLQLVGLGAAQGLTVLVFEVPTGVMADRVSRKWSLVLGHVVLAPAMVVTGLVTSFPALVVTQMLWGLGHTFLTGADVAWVTDELGRPDRVGRLLVRAARWQQYGAAVGLTGLGTLSWAAGLGPAMVVAGVGTGLLGLGVAVGFTEQRSWARGSGAVADPSASVLRRGLVLARGDRVVLGLLVGTLLVNGADEAHARLHALRLVDLGLADDGGSILWLAGLGLASLGLAAAALRVVEARIDGPTGPPRAYCVAALAGVAGLALLALAPGVGVALTGALVVGGVGMPVTRAVSVVWVNERTSSEVRATVQSLLSQSENLGEITLGLGLGVAAQVIGLPTAFALAAGLAGAAALVVSRGGRSRGPARRWRR